MAKKFDRRDGAIIVIAVNIQASAEGCALHRPNVKFSFVYAAFNYLSTKGCR